MIVFDEKTGLVTLECDSPGCKKSHSILSTVGDQGRSVMNSILATMMQDGWFTGSNKAERIEHFCPGCGVSMEGVQQLVGTRKLPPGSSTETGIVSAQELRQARSTDEALRIRSARKLDQERGTPGLSDMDHQAMERLRNMMAKGKKVFGDG